MKKLLYLGIIGILFNSVNSRFINKNDDYYLVYVNNKYGLTEEKYQKRQEPQQFVNSLIKKIHELIVENKDTYKNPEELENMDERNHPLRKRSNDVESNYVYQIASVKDTSVLLTYLSSELNEKVKTLGGVRGSGINKKINIDTPLTFDNININNKTKRDTYNNIDDDAIIDDIKSETGWKDVTIRSKVFNNLSSISQGYFNGTSEQYDNNYYYPKSAGEGIDVYIIDTGYNFRQREFVKGGERKIKCISKYENGKVNTTISEDYCVTTIKHGEKVSDSIGGEIYGVANKANIYGIALEPNETNDDYTRASLLASYDFLANNVSIRPNKSVLNLSVYDIVNHDIKEDLEFSNVVKSYMDHYNELGIIIFTSAGNFGVPSHDINSKGSMLIPGVFDNVISVGAIDNFGLDINKNIINSTNSTNYKKASWSNYGKTVNIFAPGCGVIELQNKEDQNEMSIFCGTSISSPIASAVAATIMSEHPEIKFDTQSMLSYLTEIGLKDVISDTKGSSNVFLNNGRHSVYLRNIPEKDSSIYDNVSTAINDAFVTSAVDDDYEIVTTVFNENSNPTEVADDYDTFEEVTDNVFLI